MQLRRPIKTVDSIHYILLFLKEFAYSVASTKGLLNIKDVYLQQAKASSFVVGRLGICAKVAPV